VMRVKVLIILLVALTTSITFAQNAAQAPFAEFDRAVRQETAGLLRASARQAALQTEFSPLLLSGKPVTVAGRLMYKFLAQPTP